MSGSQSDFRPAGREDVFPLEPREEVLRPLLEDLFVHHWNEVVFGPMIQGGIWEFRAERRPDRITMDDGFLTVRFGASQIHLCIGEHFGPLSDPTPAALRRERQTARAEFFRGLDDRGNPRSWGLRLFNGADALQIVFLFPDPRRRDDGRPLDPPDWGRLALWKRLCRHYLGREPDGYDCGIGRRPAAAPVRGIARAG